MKVRALARDIGAYFDCKGSTNSEAMSVVIACREKLCLCNKSRGKCEKGEQGAAAARAATIKGFKVAFLLNN